MSPSLCNVCCITTSDSHRERLMMDTESGGFKSVPLSYQESRIS